MLSVTWSGQLCVRLALPVHHPHLSVSLPLHTPPLCPSPFPTPAGAIVVDGVVASELTSLVPPALAGPAVSRSLAAALRLGFAALPSSAVEAGVQRLSSWAHGGVADAAVSAAALRMQPASAAA